MWKALHTQECRRDPDEDASGKDLCFSFAAVNHLKLRIDEHNATWEAFFGDCGVEKVVYEDLVDDYGGTVSRVVRATGIPVSDGFAPLRPKVKRQADEISEEWVHLYNKAARTGIYTGRV